MRDHKYPGVLTDNIFVLMIIQNDFEAQLQIVQSLGPMGRCTKILDMLSVDFQNRPV